VVAFHRAGAKLDWRDPTNNSPISWADPIALLSSDGEVLSSFGGDHGFVIPHGVFVDHTDCIWVTDCGLHQVFKFDREGTLLFTLGAEGGPDPDRREQKDSDNADPCVWHCCCRLATAAVVLLSTVHPLLLPLPARPLHGTTDDRFYQRVPAGSYPLSSTGDLHCCST
jgi:hypothetical protein